MKKNEPRMVLLLPGEATRLSKPILAEMSIPEGHKLHVEVCDGVAHVSDAGYGHDITDVPPMVRQMLAELGGLFGRFGRVADAEQCGDLP